MTDFLFNALILGIDALVIALVARSKRGGMGLTGAAGGLLAALVVATFLQEGTFHLFRLLAYLAFAHTPLVLLGVAWIVRARTKVISGLCVSLAIVIWGVAGYAFIIEPHRLELTVVQLHSSKVSHSIRVAIVADLQTDQIGAYERRALTMVLDAEPDLILMTGDYLHENSALRHQLAVDLNGLFGEIEFGAPMGAFATRGNTEHNDWPQLFAATRVTPFVGTATITVDEVDVTGLDLWDSFDSELHIGPSERFHIVFGHSPDFALGTVDADLLVAGHTHGGQIRLPILGPIVTMASVPRAWAAGVTGLANGRTLVVSRGIGMERGKAPRLRFLCRPEVVIVDILPEGQ